MKTPENPDGNKSILRRMIQDGRARLVKAQAKFGELLTETADMKMLWKHVGEDDPMSKEDKIRLARGATIRGSGQFEYRFTEYYSDFPHDWILAQEKDAATQDLMYDRFRKKRLCNLKPFFCRRIRRKVAKRPSTAGSDPNRAFKTQGFKRMINFWADSAESATSVRNERQHSSFLRKVRSGKSGGGAHASGKRVIVQDLLSTVVQDHETKFGEAGRRQIPKKNLRIRAKQRFQSIKKNIAQAKRRVCGRKVLGDFKLGVGRTPWLHFSNQRMKAAKADRVGKIPLEEQAQMREQWAKEWNESPALQAMYQAEVNAARDKRRAKAQAAHTRQKLGFQPASDEDNEDDKPQYGPVADVVDNTLWGAGDLNYPVSAGAIIAHAGEHTSLSGFANVVAEKSGVPYAHDIHVRDAPLPGGKERYGKWRSKVRSCFERHPGLCCAEAGNLYKPVLALASKIQGRVTTIIDGSQAKTVFDKVGEAVFRFQSVPSAEYPASTVRFFILSYYNGNPRRCAFCELQHFNLDDDQVGDIGFPHMLRLPLGEQNILKHITGHTLALQLLRQHCDVWSCAEISFTDFDLCLLRADAVLHEACFVFAPFRSPQSSLGQGHLF